MLRKRKMVMTGFYSDVNGVDGKVEQVDGGGDGDNGTLLKKMKTTMKFTRNKLMIVDL